VIELVNVTKVYKVGSSKVLALDNVSLKIPTGSFYAIMGPSGSGKTTLINIIGLLDKPSKGKVLIDGIDVGNLPEKKINHIRMKKIGFVFQLFHLIPWLTVLQNVEVPLMIAGVPKNVRRKRAIELLKMVGLENRIHHRPTQLSGGEQQRVAIARALANNPEIILADEPTGNLDSKTGHEIMEALAKLNRYEHKTVIVVTHDPEVASYANTIVYLRDGKVQRIEVR